MYKLTRISLINWYLISAKDIDIRDATAFIGPTGAGKSSIQDAIQTVICGGNHRYIHPNASANGKSERKIIDYCLCYLSPKKDGGQPLRSSCETVLALVFSEERPNGHRYDITVGCAMRAHKDDSREMLITRFVAPGYAFSVTHATEYDEHHHPQIKTWEDIEGTLKRACPEAHWYRNSAEKFVTDMLAEMRKHGRQPDTRHFLHTFSNAITFRPIFDPTVFVRSYILEPDVLDVDRVRDAISRWRYLADAVRQVEEKLKRLEAIRRKYEDWGSLVINRTVNLWGLACARTEQARIKLRRLGAALADAKANLEKAQTLETRLKAHREEERAELRRLQISFAEKGAHSKLALIATEQENLHLRLKSIDDMDLKIRQTLQMVTNLDEAKNFLPISAQGIIAGAKSTLALMDKPGPEWLSRHAHTIDEYLKTLKTLATLPDRLKPQQEDLHAQRIDLRKRRDMAGENARRAAQGSSPLSPHTISYLSLLRDNGIEAKVLCDVTEVTDSNWQFAAESLLGLFREAIIVEPPNLDQANEILFINRNRPGQQLYKVRLVKTSRTHMVGNRFDADSLASVLKTDNPHAKALICSHLGRVKMVKTKNELEQTDRGIMKDGRATSGLAYSVNSNLSLILGRQDSSIADGLHEEVNTLRKEVARIDGDIKRLEQATRTVETLSNFTANILDSANNYENIRRRQNEIEHRKQTILSQEDRRLAEEIRQLEAEIKERDNEVDEASASLNTVTGILARTDITYQNGKDSLRQAVKDKRQASSAFSDINLQTALRWASPETLKGFSGTTNPYFSLRLAGSLPRHCEEHIVEYEINLRNIDDRISRLGGAARNALDNYLRDYGIDRPMIDEKPYTYDYDWTVLQHQKLSQNELRQHKDMAETAEREMYHTLKEDLLINLNSLFNKLDHQLKTLNRRLKHHKFTGQYYKFGRKPDPRFDKIRRLAQEIGNNPDQAQAIIERRSSDPILQQAMDELNEYLDNTGGEGLEDYRNYFTFDMYMYRDISQDNESPEIGESEIKEKGLITLSSRATVSSGGEGQAPFYVAIAASMALAYYPGDHPNGTPSGMGLVLFDEAFNKLDIPTTQSLIRFYKDLGLQLLLAAPEDKRPTFTEVLDCIVSVNKDEINQFVHLESEYPTPYAQEQMAKINPDHLGIEGFRAQISGGSNA